MEISEKELVGLRCCCLELDRRCHEIESCEIHQTFNVNISGLGDPNLVKTFSGDGQLYSVIMNVLLVL